MRSTHGQCICNHFHLIIQDSYRDSKNRISAFLALIEIFFPIYDHIIIVGAAPLEPCIHLPLFY